MSARNEIVNGRMSAVTLTRFDNRWAWNDNECWVWQGHCTAEGYGVMRVGQKRVPAHRVSYEHFVGPIPEGLVLDHLCRNRPCVNPAHLEPVLNAENVDRGVGITAVNSRKTHCKRGHEFTSKNTRVTPNGKRECRTCHREKVARLKMAKTEKEDNVPDLPVEPYTVIRVTWDAAKVRSTDVTCTLVNGYWRGLADFLSPNELADRILGFEVLSEPRPVTAKAVLDWAEPYLSDRKIAEGRYQFGVEQ